MKRYINFMKNAYKVPVVVALLVPVLWIVWIVTFVGLLFNWGLLGLALGLGFALFVLTPFSVHLVRSMFDSHELDAWFDSGR